MTQDDAAKHLGVSRPTFVQIEAGNRSVSSLELDKLAYLFGRDIREFVADAFHEEDSLTALFRAQPAVVGEPAVLDKLRECMALGRELDEPRASRRYRPRSFDGRLIPVPHAEGALGGSSAGAAPR